MTKSKRIVTTDVAHANAQAIRRVYQAGRRSLKRQERLQREQALHHYDKKGVLAADAVREGLNPDTMKKAQRAASEFSDDDIAAICDRVVHHQSRFGPTNFLMLLRVEDRRQRDALMRKAIRHSWSSRKLERTIQGLHGCRRAGGRKGRIPADPVERLIAFDALIVKWQRWTKAARSRLSKKVRSRLAKAAQAVDVLQAVVADDLDAARACRGDLDLAAWLPTATD